MNYVGACSMHGKKTQLHNLSFISSKYTVQRRARGAAWSDRTELDCYSSLPVTSARIGHA